MDYTPNYIERDDLLDDPRFWRLLYGSQLEPLVGDPADDLDLYFFDGPYKEKENFWIELNATPSPDDTIPVLTACVELVNHWRIGVGLSFCPGDYDIEVFITEPQGTRHVIGVVGGNFFTPALRWEELLTIAHSIRPANATAWARGILLFYLASSADDSQAAEVTTVLREAWSQSGFCPHHLDEWISRESVPEGKYWVWNEQLGWLYDRDAFSLRSFKGCRHQRTSPAMLEAVKQMFATL